MTTGLAALWERNRLWRAWMDANTPFVTPETLDTLRYMLIECCEVLDLWMRDRNPNHARNNERNSTICQELADVAMLALTAIPDGSDLSTVGPVLYVFDIDECCLYAAQAIQSYKENDRRWRGICEDILIFVLAHDGFDLAAELDKCHRRLAWKHGSHALAAAGSDAPWMVEAEVAA